MSELNEAVKRYTYADYYSWDDGERWELIDGIPYAMGPAPHPDHQTALGNLFALFKNFLKGKPCKVYLSPFDVRLNADERDDTVVQPDLLVVCDMTRLDYRGYKGPPELVIEILSPSSSKHDNIRKLNLYKRSGIREYWIVNPIDKTVSTLILKDGEYIMMGYIGEDTIPVHVLEGCMISLADVFADQL